MKRSRAGFAVTISFLSLLTLATPGTVTAQKPQGDVELMGFELIGDYTLLVDGEESTDAQIHRSQRAGGAILVVDGSLGSAFLLSPRSLQVDSVPMADLKKNSDGTVDIPSTAKLSREGVFELTSEAVVFELGGRNLRLQDRAPLLGLRTGDDVLAFSPEYPRAAAAYKPSSPIVRRLRESSQPARVRVFFGTWCAYCKQAVPKVLRLGQELEGSLIKFEYYGLPRGFSHEPEASRMKIESVPTAVIFVGDKEADRISGRDWRIPELFLTDVLSEARGQE